MQFSPDAEICPDVSSDGAYQSRRKAMKRTKTIIIESHQVQIIRRRADGPTVEAWCASCAAHVAHLTPDAAAQFTGRTTRELYRQVEAGDLHFCETTEGGLLLCQSSLASSARDPKIISGLVDNVPFPGNEPEI